MTSATIIHGRAIAQGVREQVAGDVARLTERTGAAPGLATVLVGADPASDVYVTNKQRACAEAGIVGFDHRLAAESTADEVTQLLGDLNADPAVSGILLQLPLPAHLDAVTLTELIAPAKDVDGLTAVSAGRLAQGQPGLRPCTPSGVIALLDAQGVALEGAQMVILGRSLLVGRPLAALALERNATVTICHSRTRNLAAVCARADVLVAAVGVPRMVGREFVAPGAVLVDVGINRGPDGLVGDVDFEAVADRAAAITPVPGGVGPMTIAMLLRNTVLAARQAARLDTAGRLRGGYGRGAEERGRRSCN